MSLADNLRLLMERHGDNPHSLGQSIGVPQPTIFRMLEGITKEPRRSTLEPIARRYGVTVEELIYGIRGDARQASPHVFGVIENRPPELIPVKRVAFRVIDGEPVAVHSAQTPPLHFPQDTLDKLGLKRDSIFALTVGDRSMETSLFEGDIVLVDTAAHEPKDGHVFAVLDEDGELLMRRMKRDAGQWYMCADADDKRRYPDKALADQKVLGRIILKQSTII